MKLLRVLIVEDSEDDAVMLLRHLRLAGYEVTSERVETADAMRAALTAWDWDVILADYQLPQFSAAGALEVLTGTRFDLPFIIVSGAIGEEAAVSLLKAGAHDFVLKGNLARLVPAIERELRGVRTRWDRAAADEALRRSEERYRGLFEGIPVGAYRTTPDGRFLDVNRSCTVLLGFSGRDELVGVAASSLYVDPEQREAWRRRVEATSGAAAMELRIRRGDGSVIWVRDTGHAVHDAAGRVQYYEGILEDVTERHPVSDAPAARPATA